jgi:hypothetical protein
MSCIICQDTCSEPLQDNTHCSCKYKIHNSCLNDYVNSTDKVKCLLCRKEILIKPVIETIHTPLIQPAIETIQTPIIQPSAPPYASPESQGQQITYQEFVEIISQYETSNIITIQPTQQVNSQPNSKKIIKIIIGLGLLFVILLIFVLLIKLL